MKWPHEEVVGSHPCSWVVELLSYQTLWRLVLSSLLGLCHLQSDGCLCGLCGIPEPRAQVSACPTQGWSSGLGNLVSPRGDVAAWEVRVVVLKW